MTPEQIIRRAILDHPDPELALAGDLAESLVAALDRNNYEIRSKLPELEDKQQITDAIAKIVERNATVQADDGYIFTVNSFRPIAEKVADFIDHNLRFDGGQIRVQDTDPEPSPREIPDFGVEVVAAPAFDDMERIDIDPDDPYTVIAATYRRWHHLAPAAFADVLRDTLTNENGYIIRRLTEYSATGTVIGVSSDHANGVYGIRLTYPTKPHRPLPSIGQPIAIAWDDPPPDNIAIIRDNLDKLCYRARPEGGWTIPEAVRPEHQTELLAGIYAALDRLEEKR